MKIQMFQNCHKPALLKEIPEGLCPLPTDHTPTHDLREYFALELVYSTNRYRDAELTGVLSPKFQQKARIAPRQFIDWVAATPGYDLYILNPFPQDRVIHANIWDNSRGHSGRTPLHQVAARLLVEAGFGEIDLLGLPRQEGHLSYCNFWAGNALFWESYMPFLQQLVRAGVSMSEELFQQDWNLGTPYFPYIIERMLTTYLEIANPGLRIKAYRYDDPRSQCRSGEETRLYDLMKPFADEIDRRGGLSRTDVENWLQLRQVYRHHLGLSELPCKGQVG